MSVSQPTLTPLTSDLPTSLRQRIFSLPNLLTLLYLILGGSLVIKHGIWRDEAQAFLIARDSTWPLDVIRNTRYEGHPPLWHLILYVLTRFTINPAAMQWLHLFMAAGSVYLVARFSPFPTRAKILFAFGYFTLFEYAIIARNYQLFLLLTLAFCTLWQQGLGKGRRSFIWLGLILAGLCLTHVLGIILAAGLGLMLLIDSGFTRDGWKSIARNPIRFACGILIAGLGAWLAVKSLIPEPDNNFNSAWSSDLDPNHVQNTLATLWNAYVPIPEWGDWHFWNSNFMGAGGFDNVSYLGKPNPNSPWNTAAYRGTWMAVIALILMSLSWRAVAFFLISTLGLLAFTHYKFGGALRHHGALFVALVAAFWIALIFHRPRPTVLWRRILWTLPRETLVLLLLLQAIGGYVATYYAWRHPFSPAREAAALLKPQLTPDDQLFAWYPPACSTLAAFIPDRKIYYPEDGRWGTFAIWKNFPGGMRSDLQGAYDFARQTGKPVIYISPNNLGRAPTVSGPLGIFSPRPPAATFLGGLPAGMIDNESYYFYRVMPPAPATIRATTQAATRP